MKKILLLPLLFGLAFVGNLAAQVNLTESNLPILVITTPNGQEILDEPKIQGHLGIVWNGPGQMNQITDPFNDYDGDINIEKRGSSSQWFPKVPYAVETILPDGTNNNVSLLGLPAENDWVLNGPYTDKSLMRDPLTYTLAGWLMEYAPRVMHCELIINGDYLGVYILTEKIKRDENRVNISKLNPDDISGDELTGGYILKFDKWTGANNDGFNSTYPPYPGSLSQTSFLYHYPKPEDITQEQKAYIQDYMKQVEDNLQSPNFTDPLTGYRQYFDMASFFNYFFVQEIPRNVDGYRLSSYFYKDKDSVNPKIKMGPAWDFNLGFGNVDYCIGPSPQGWAIDFASFCPNDWVPHFWWHRMMNDPSFRTEMRNRWVDLRNDTLSTERLLGYVDSIETLLTVPASRNFDRWPTLSEYVWPNSFIGHTYAAEVEFLREWLLDRLNWMDGAMEQLTAPVYDPAEYFSPEVNPNPFLGKATFKYYVNAHLDVKVEIYNTQGQVVAELFDEEHLSGESQIVWEPRDLPAGMYFYKVYFGKKKVQEGKLVHLER